MAVKTEYKDKISNFYHKFYRENTTLGDKRRVTLHVTISGIGITFLIIFSIIAFIQKNYPLSIADIFTALILGANLFHLRKKKKNQQNIIFGVVFVSLLFIFLYVTGGTSNTAFVWYYTYPLITCYLLGSFFGLVTSLSMLLPVFFLMVFNSENPLIMDYDLNFELRFIAAYTVVVFFSYSFERHGESIRSSLNETNLLLEKKIQERTYELLVKNKQLKKQIKEKKKAEKSVIQSQKNLAIIMDSIDSIIYVSELESCNIVFMNKYLTDFVGANLVGKSCWQHLLKKKKRCDKCRKDILMAGNKKNMAPVIWEGENPITKKWSINVDRTMKWSDDRFVHLHIATDIMHIKKLQDKHKEMEIQLQQSQKMEAIGTLAGGIAHDFNNILSGIFGYSQLAKMNIEDSKKAKKNIDLILKGAERAAALVKQILTYSRQIEYKKQPVSVYIMVKDTLKLLRSSIPSNIEIKENVFSKALVLADPTQIHQVIMNLCTNAYQAMSDTGGVLTVGLDDYEVLEPGENTGLEMSPGKYLKLEVKDTGPGIDKENIEKIFNPYFTTKEIGKGTGLGLAMVDGIMKNHNGYIKLDSEVGKGSAFHLFWPVVEQNDSN